MTPVEVKRGDSPLVLGLPHTGTHVPDEIFDNPDAARPDAGRYRLACRPALRRLAEWRHHRARQLPPLRHRRQPRSVRRSLYPGQNTTGLVPLTNFDKPLWLEEPGRPPRSRRADLPGTRPITRHLRPNSKGCAAIHGVAILYDCHSIRSKIPYLFEGTLPDFNIGTNNGRDLRPADRSCGGRNLRWRGRLFQRAQRPLQGRLDHPPLRSARRNMHAIQMELAQSTRIWPRGAALRSMTRRRRSGCAFSSRHSEFSC
jgi:N-formylglutamate deformylase